MKIDTIARLFAAQSEPALSNQKQSTNVGNQRSVPDSEAVKVSKQFGGFTEAANDSESREAKVARLKSEYDNGTLKYDSEKVASAVYKELLI